MFEMMLSKKKGGAPIVTGETPMPMTGITNGTKYSPMVVYGDYLYVFGGQNTAGSWVTAVWRFHRVDRVWESMAVLLTAVAWASVTVKDNKAYLISGNAFYQVYDFALNSWTQVTAIGLPRYSKIFNWNGDLYVLGGQLYNSTTGTWADATSIYKLTAPGTWEATTTTLRAGYPNAELIGDEVIFAGGNQDGSWVSTVRAYNMSTGVTRSIGVMRSSGGVPVSLSFSATTVKDGKLLSFGGNIQSGGDGTENNALYAIDPVANSVGITFRSSQLRRYASAASASEGVYIYGGAQGNTQLNTMFLMT